jgi:thioredoxin reductase
MKKLKSQIKFQNLFCFRCLNKRKKNSTVVVVGDGNSLCQWCGCLPEFVQMVEFPSN